MRIAASEINLDSANYNQTTTEVHERLTVGRVRAGDSFTAENLVSGRHQERHQLNISQSSERLVSGKQSSTYADPRIQSAQPLSSSSLFAASAAETTTNTRDLLELQPLDKLRLQLLMKLYEHLTGKTLKIGMLGQLAPGTTDRPGLQEMPTEITEPGLEYGMRYDYQETRTHTEATQFTALGEVRTEDGQTIQLNLQLNLSRSLQETRSFQIRAGAALKDPLVINFSGSAAELQNRALSFDLDADGDLEQIHQLSDRSGYLALDRNQNGSIDNGNELFGVHTGNGFQELARYDDDGNGFIDESDAIWSDLRIWVQHDDGSQSLLTLEDKDIGALYLGYTATDWDLSAGEHSDQLAGKLRATGLFLTEQGHTGTLQQVDLVV